MQKKLWLCCLLFSNLVIASDLYTKQLELSNRSPGLTIKFPSADREEGIPVGPTDATVIDNKFVVLDTYGSAVSYFDSNGSLLKKILLPHNIQFQNIVRDRDNSLFVFGTNQAQTMVVHIQNEAITEQSIFNTTKHYIDYIIPDDYGLIMKGTEIPPVRQTIDQGQQDCKECRNLSEQLSIPFQDRVERNCISCELKSAEGVNVGGLLYHISSGKNPSFFIGTKKVPLNFYKKYRMNAYEILQVDQDGTAWIENLIMFDGPSITYVWKVNKLGEVLGIYRFASDKEISSTSWPMQHQVVVSNDGKVYGLISNKNKFKFILLKQLTVKEMKERIKSLDSVLFKKSEFKPKKISIVPRPEFLTAGCRTRQKALDDAYDYLLNKIYLSSSSINNDATCPNRIIPPYLLKGTAQTYDSVSYNWGGFDTIAEFNTKILTSKLKAGNVNSKNSPLLSCTAGVDCSGYVSRAWGLTSKLGTYDIASDQITDEIDYYDVKTSDVFVIPGVHVMLYRMKDDILGRRAVIEESNYEAGRVIEQKLPISWLREQKFLPRRAKSNIICR